MSKNPDASDEPIWSVVVVHGVGETEPGETLDSFVAPLDAAFDHLTLHEPPEVRWLPEPAPHLPSREARTEIADPAVPVGMDQRFPMHVRHVDVVGAAEGSPRKAFFAEVYWSDLANTDKEISSLLARLFTCVFHLRYVSDTAAISPLTSARWLRFFLFWIGYLICGPIAAANLLMGLLIAGRALFANLESAGWIREGFADGGRAIVMMHSLAAVAGAYLAWHSERRKWDAPWSLIFRWTVVWAVVLGWKAVDRFLVNDLGIDAETPFIRHFSAMIEDTGWCFVVLGAALVGSAVSCILACMHATESRHRAAFAGALATAMVQTGLWVLIVPALAAVEFKYLQPPMFPTDGPWGRSAGTFVFHLMLALGVVVAGLVVAGWRHVWYYRYVGPKALPDPPPIPRMILHRSIVVLILVAAFLGSADFIYGAFTGNWPIDNGLQKYAAKVNWAVLIGASLTMWFLRGGLKSGLHILMDVVNHFYRRKLTIPWPWTPMQPLRVDDCVVQQRIEARMRRVLQEVVQRSGGKVVRLTVLAHSQGTMVAINTLWLDWTARLLDGCHVELATMGSPFTHLYQHYFPVRYPDLFLDDGTFNRGRWGDSLPTVVRRWINLHRADDFIGLEIDGGVLPDGREFPENNQIPGHGHTYYWSQAEVQQKLKDMLPG